MFQSLDPLRITCRILHVKFGLSFETIARLMIVSLFILAVVVGLIVGDCKAREELDHPRLVRFIPAQPNSVFAAYRDWLAKHAGQAGR